MVINRPVDDILFEVDDEIQNLYDYYRVAGLSHEEILEKARPLLSPIGKETLKRKCFALFNIVLVVFAIGAVLSSDHVLRTVSMNGRHLLFKMLPWWDWTDLYHSSCFIYNPYFQNHQVLMTDCRVCEDFFEIDRINSSSPEEISHAYLQNDIPVIVSDAMSDWPAMEDSFTILNLTEGYLFMDELAYQEVCMFQTNLRVNSHHKVFEKILSDQSIMKWYAHWENCQKPAEKFLRRFYVRPYFIPDIVQMTESNWLFMSSSYRGRKLKSVEILPSITVMWVAQLRGYNFIHMEPKAPCDNMCNILEDTLEEGDIVLFSPAFWNFSYLPGEGTENLAIAAGGFSHFV